MGDVINDGDTALLRRHPIWHGRRTDWEFVYSRNYQAFDYESIRGTRYRLKFNEDVPGIWIGKLVYTEAFANAGDSWYWKDVTAEVHAKWVKFSTGGRYVFPERKPS